MAISKRVRFEVFKRDRFACQYCGKRPPEVLLEVDHVVPRVEGGTDDMSNLTTACMPCNRGKAGVPLGNIAPALDEMEVLAGIQEMLERASTLRRSAVVAEAKRSAEDAVIATIRDWWKETVGYDGYVQDASLRRFLRDLTPDDIRQAIDVAESGRERKRLSAYDTWKYFCGICWEMVRRGAGGQ